MDTKLKLEREVRNVPDRSARLREDQVRRLQVEHGYSRADAAKLYEYQSYLGAKTAMCTAVGGIAAYKVGPFQAEAALRHPLFRKTWMRVPMQAAAFAGGYYVAAQFSTRFFPKYLSYAYYNRESGKNGVNANSYQHDHDLISKFRFFEGTPAAADGKQSIEDYLDLYQSGPLTKAELLNRLADGRAVDPEFAQKFRIKRMGKDKDDIFWALGKIHGLENLALADADEVAACKGDPMKLQRLVDKINDSPKPSHPANHELLVTSLHDELEAYQAAVAAFEGKRELLPSDKKKLLSLPIYLSKRAALPEPRYGQKEWRLFEDLYGRPWNAYESLRFDSEEKITEFNYEKYLPKHLLKGIDTQADDFIMSIKAANFKSKTAYEQHEADKRAFQKLIPILSRLDEEECEIFMHLIKNKGRSQSPSEQRTFDLIDSDCSDELRAELARISEEENYSLKNRYKHEKDTMKYAEASRMPIEQTKVKDLLRYQNLFREKVLEEMQVYGEDVNGKQLQHGILTYVNEASWGDLRELLKDVGINKYSINFHNVAEILKAKDQILFDSDKNFSTLANSRYLQVDMTDYEEDFPSWNETDLQFHNIGALTALGHEKWPEAHALIEVNELETMPKNTTGRTHKELLESRSAEEEEEEEDEDEEDEDEEEEGDEEGEEGDGDEDEEDEEEDDEEEDEGVPEDKFATPRPESAFFKHHETLNGKYNEVELDGFMKLLNVRARPQWQDETTHHYKVGTHTYEDEGQQMDPYFHLIAEVERKHMERQQALEFRRGSEIKFVMDPKKKPQYKGN